MANAARFYVLGPPVERSEDIPSLVMQVMSKVDGNLSASAQTVDLESPVRFASGWVPGGRSKPPRIGEGVYEMWSGRVLWPATQRSRSFTVVVMDENYLLASKDTRKELPDFESFVVSVLHENGIGNFSVYEWLTQTFPSWRKRENWLRHLIASSESERRAADVALSTKPWEQLLVLNALFPAPGGAIASRRNQRGPRVHRSGCHRAGHALRLDNFIPEGLRQFLYGFVARPRTYEQICRCLWDAECARLDAADLPAWFNDTCPANLVSTAEHLQKWWWGNIIGAASGAVHQLQSVADNSVSVVAEPVKGLSFRHYRTLHRSPEVSAVHSSLIAECATAGIHLNRVDLGSGAQVIVRGLCTGGCIPRENESDEENSYLNQAQRLVVVKWSLTPWLTASGTWNSSSAATASTVTFTSVHYIAKFDTTNKWFLFEDDVAVSLPANMNFSMAVIFGPWAGHGRRYFEFVGDRHKALCIAQNVMQVLPVRAAYSRVVPLARFGDRGSSKWYVVLGGPGVGKTSQRIMELLKARCEEGGHRILLYSSLREVRNNCVKLLQTALPSATFDAHVRVIGNNGLDELSRSRTTSALVWRRMKDVVAGHEKRLMQLGDAAAHVSSLGALSRRLSPAIATLIEEFGGFNRTLATMHSIVARERCALEVHVTTVTNAVKNSYRLVVATIGSLFGSTGFDELGKELGPFTFLLGDEGTRTQKFELDMLMACLGAKVSSDASLGFVGDPCQVQAAFKTLNCTKTLTNNFGLGTSSIAWLLERFLAEKPTPQDFVSRVDLLNRVQPSLRCRVHACAAVNRLALSCLPGQRHFWETVVDGKRVWADLVPSPAQSAFDKYRNENIPEVVSVSSEGSPAQSHCRDSLYGFRGKSRYDGDVALNAVLAAYTAAFLQLRLRRSFDDRVWRQYFTSIEEARRWKLARISVKIICAYAAMVDLCCLAVLFVQEVCAMKDVHDITVSCASADAVQGETFDIMVLALPPSTKRWTTWQCEARRLLTITSRYASQVIITYIEDDGMSERCKDYRANVQVILDLQQAARDRWTWSTMAPIVGWKLEDSRDIWTRWITRFNHWRSNTEPEVQVQATSVSAATASTALSPIFSSAISYRKHRLLILRYMRSLLRIVRQDPEVLSWVHEVRCRLKENRFMMALRFTRETLFWLETDFMPSVRNWYERMFGVDGTVVSFLSELSSTEHVQLFSAVVIGLGEARASMWGVGRMEWLAVEIVSAARSQLQERVSDRNDTAWNRLEDLLKKPREDIDLSIAIAPHKMRMTGDELEASAAGAGERADILLLAWGTHDQNPSVLGWAYHTTNVPPGTASMRRGQVYNESRILWRHNVPLHEIIKTAAMTLATKLGVATPAPDTELLDQDLWGDSVFRQGPAVERPREDIPGYVDISESDDDYDS